MVMRMMRMMLKWVVLILRSLGLGVVGLTFGQAEVEVEAETGTAQ